MSFKSKTWWQRFLQGHDDWSQNLLCKNRFEPGLLITVYATNAMSEFSSSFMCTNEYSFSHGIQKVNWSRYTRVIISKIMFNQHLHNYSVFPTKGMLSAWQTTTPRTDKNIFDNASITIILIFISVTNGSIFVSTVLSTYFRSAAV